MSAIVRFGFEGEVSQPPGVLVAQVVTGRNESGTLKHYCLSLLTHTRARARASANRHTELRRNLRCTTI
jgi:hypothetical protein